MSLSKVRLGGYQSDPKEFLGPPFQEVISQGLLLVGQDSSPGRNSRGQQLVLLYMEEQYLYSKLLQGDPAP